ncbi:OmpA/MotB domain protein [Rhodomicrobium vannielii ATCC 17100]|uniref:OmpA/MotB domain protein n=1 Tax=Rhodomicrobium vannielii (strain ATCC 17100 / DSM 162 / LMG 4299 / NCIMB 10020 / ATH 3.1.1) TaxID=648757 RepID=E3I6R6_RHOVT|nr:flagellar motor protein MotB [Rhodomicrobium vannielii]ADP71784.1 OmpA/MotB domain protein [Rhodomicrobium vannielii ATCC 17100]
MARHKKNERAHADIVVRKKLYRSDGDNHGGVWKIAYADFMTAMMTFFLVMWLVNSSSKERLSQIANYFNPVKLNEHAPPAKDVAATAPKAQDKSPAAGRPNSAVVDPKDRHVFSEEELTRNPFGVLTQLATQAEEALRIASKEQDSSAAAGQLSRDPFVAEPRLVRTAKVSTSSGSQTAPGEWSDAPKSHKSANVAETERKEPAASLAEQILKDIESFQSNLPQSFRVQVSVAGVAEGTLISLMDDTKRSMFDVGSAMPKPDTVLVMTRIGDIISKYPGKIIIRGYTDGRPFAGDRYGNWVLSSQRARMAFLMLARGKIGDGRVLSIEGYADRQPRNADDPLAPENRRIEVLLKDSER